MRVNVEAVRVVSRSEEGGQGGKGGGVGGMVEVYSAMVSHLN